jgi:putative ABC transport system permease protein
MVVRWFNDGMVDVGLVPVLGLWQATAFLILLIACANVANLLLARGAARQREMALRLAIGAGRRRLIRQLLVESLVLALAAVPAALVVAAMTFGVLRGAMPAELVKFVPGFTEMGVDVRVGLVTVAAAVLATIFFGLLPAIQASRPGLSNTLKDGGRSSASPARSRLRRGLVVAEVALALPLLVASGMSAIGAQRFSSGPQGYEPQGVLSLRLSLPAADYPDRDARRQFTTRLLERVRSVPGVDSVATASVVPSTTNNQRAGFEVDGTVLDADAAPPLVNYRAVSPGYLELLQIPLEEGRTINRGDVADAERVAVVSRSAADRFWPDESPIGRRVKIGANPTGWTTVVGVVGDTIDDWFAYRNVPTVYVAHDQRPASAVHLVTRSAGDPAGLAAPVRQAVADIDATLAPSDVMPLTEAIKLRTTGIKFIGGIMAAFGFIALGLATLGIYGVMAYFVAQRRREIGIRMALGASAREVLLQTVTRGGRMAALGIAIGLVLAVLLARLMESALFGAVAIEAWLFVAIASVLAAVALAASIVPARSASRVDPVVALRTD